MSHRPMRHIPKEQNMEHQEERGALGPSVKSILLETALVTDFKGPHLQNA